MHEGSSHGRSGVHVDVEKYNAGTQGFKENDGLGRVHGVAAKAVHLDDDDGGILVGGEDC